MRGAIFAGSGRKVLVIIDLPYIHMSRILPLKLQQRAFGENTQSKRIHTEKKIVPCCIFVAHSDVRESLLDLASGPTRTKLERPQQAFSC